MAAEIEHKYEVPLDFAVDERIVTGGARLGEPAVHELVAVYYDTADLRLAADRVALRQRTGGHDAGWHVKRYRAEDRDEVQLDSGPTKGVPAAVKAEVRAITRGGSLRPTVRMTTRRTEWPLLSAGGEVLALVADDEVAAELVADPAAGQRWRELEVELVTGDRALLKAVGKRLRKAGATRAAAPAKIARALDGRWPSDAPAPAGPEGSAAAVVGAYARRQRDAIVEYDPRVRRDEPDAVHKMRVATRRLRSTLRTFRPLWDRTAADELRAELRWLAEVLGKVRDAEVMAARLQGGLAALPTEQVVGPVAARLTGGLTAQAAADRTVLLAALDGRRYAALLDDLDELLAAPPTERGLRPAARYVPQRVRWATRKVDALLDAADAAAAAPPRALPLPGVLDRDTALHEARKAAKKARYAAEAAAPVGGSGAAALVTALEDLQEVLGEHHDTVVVRDLLRTTGMQAYAAGENAFTYGVLEGVQRSDAAGLEARLPAARKALRAKKARSWLA